MPKPSAERVRRYRAGLRRAGLKPVQIWLPDTNRPGFAKECEREARIVAAADAADPELGDLLDAALADLDRRDDA